MGESRPAAFAGGPPAREATSARRHRRRGYTIGAAVVAATALAYFATFVAYGYHLGEDGDVVYLIYRTFAGQRPYVDFASGYTPGHYYFNASLLHLFGVDLRVLRWSLVLINGGAALCLYLLGARLMPPLLAMVPAFAYVALMPLYAGEFATFNIPYPAWHVVLLWGLSLLAFLRSRRGEDLAWIFCAGLCAGVACAFKPNTGAFNFAALGLLLVATSSPGRSLTARLVWCGLLVGVLVALAATFGFRVASRDARLLLWPVFALAAVIALAAPRRFREEPSARFVGRALMLLLGFAAVTAPWVIHYLRLLGTQRFLREVLFIGSGHELFFYMGIRPLGLWDGLMAASALALVAISLRPPAWVRQPRRLLLLAMAFGCVAAAGVWSAPMPEGFQRAATARLEHLAYGAALILHWAAVALVARRLRQTSPSRGDERWSTEIAVAISAPLLFLSIYPRSDFFHWVLSAPFTLLLGVLLYDRLAARWLPRRQRAWAALPLYAALLVVWAPGLSLALRVRSTPAAATAQLDLAHAPVSLEAGRAPRLHQLHDAVDYVERHTAANATLLGFPNLHLLNFLSGRHVPGRYGSFNPGWPDHVIEASIVDDLERQQTPIVVISQSQQLYIGNAPVYYFLLKNYLRRHYRLAARFGDYYILERGSGDAAAELASQGATIAPAKMEEDGARCGIAIDAFRGSASLSAEALAPCWNPAAAPRQEEAVALARGTLDPLAAVALARALRDGALTPRAALVAVRAIAECGDARSFLPAADAVDKLDGQVRDELITALLDIAVHSFFASQQIFPQEIGLDEIRADDGLATRARLWLGSPDMRLQYVGAWLAGVRQDRDMEGGLRALIGRPPVEFQAVAADSLLRLGVSDGIAEPLLDGMAIDEMYLPAALFEWSRRNPQRARSLLAERYRSGNALQRESIAFVAGALGDPALAEVIRPGIADAEPRVRMASIWAAGALRDQAARAAIERAAASDPLEQARQFAAIALIRIDATPGTHTTRGGTWSAALRAARQRVALPVLNSADARSHGSPAGRPGGRRFRAAVVAPSAALHAPARPPVAKEAT